jgi:hypothetical protein
MACPSHPHVRFPLAYVSRRNAKTYEVLLYFVHNSLRCVPHGLPISSSRSFSLGLRLLEECKDVRSPALFRTQFSPMRTTWPAHLILTFVFPWLTSLGGMQRRTKSCFTFITRFLNPTPIPQDGGPLLIQYIRSYAISSTSSRDLRSRLAVVTTYIFSDLIAHSTAMSEGTVCR